jgi:hypothetical protein
MTSFLSDWWEAFIISRCYEMGGPPGPERSRGEQGGGRLVRLRRTSPVRNALK